MSTAFRKGKLVIMQHAAYFTDYDSCLGVVPPGSIQTTATDMRDMKEKVRSGYRVNVFHPDVWGKVVARPHQQYDAGGSEFSPHCQSGLSRDGATHRHKFH